MKNNLRLSMNLLIKNEEDIIADNIKVHSSLGVDCFVVIDNGSTDNTRDIIDELKKQYEILIIDKPVADYQQSNWKTEMAFKSKKILKADWSIANDADEFWIPDEGDLKAELTRFGSVIKYPRYNMQLDSDFLLPGYKYHDSCLQVKLSIDNKAANIIDDDDLSIMLGKINGKVMVNNHGLLRVKGGNHRAWHLWGSLNARKSHNVKVYHYPIRTLEHFFDHIENRAKLLKSGVTKMGDHYRRWVRLYEEGKIDQEIERLVLNKEDVKVLKKVGVLTENENPKKIISGIVG